MMPFVVTFAAMSFLSGPIYGRIGGKAAISLGALAMAAGPLLLSTIHVGANYGSLVAGLVVTGAGVGIFYGAVTTEGVTAVDHSRTSLAGAIIRLPEAVGGAVGLAVATLIFDISSSRDLELRAPEESVPLDEGQKEVVQGVLAGTDDSQEVFAETAKAVGNEMEALVRETFVTGLQAGFRYVAAVAAVGLVVALLFIKKQAPDGESTPTA